jgi:hypothetical protein
VSARSAAERARAWRQRQHAAARNEVMGLLATLPEVAIADALGRLTTGQLRLLGDHLLTVSVRQARRDLEQGNVRGGANSGPVDVDAANAGAHTAELKLGPFWSIGEATQALAARDQRRGE